MYNYLEKINSLSYGDFKAHGILQVAKKKGYVCPHCGNGSGDDGDGISDEHREADGAVTSHCFKCNTDFNNIKILAEVWDLDSKSDFKEILRRAKAEFFGVYDDSPTARPANKVPAKKSADEAIIEMVKADIIEARGNLREFVDSQGGKFRGLTLETLERFGCGYLLNWNHPNHRLECQQGKGKLPPPTRRFIAATPIHYNAIVLPQDRKRIKQQYWKMHTSPKEYFGLELLPVNVDFLIVTEGEVDAMSIWQATGGKYEVIALGGAGEKKLAETLLSLNLPHTPNILILLDSDEAGKGNAPSLQKSLQENGFAAVAEFLFDDVTKTDANDILVNQGDSVLAEKIDKLVAAAQAEFEKIRQEFDAKLAERKAEMQAAIKDLDVPEETIQKIFELGGTDKDRAEKIVLLFGDKLKYLYDLELWARYTSGIWNIGKSGNSSSIFDLAVKTGEVMKVYATDPAQEKAANAFTLKNPISKACSLVPAIDRVRMESDVFDKYPMLLPVDNGVIDLETGKLLSHAPKYYFTKKCPIEYQQGNRSELFDKFMRDILPDENTRRAVLRFLGYCLTGDVREEKALFIQGSGRNGKGTLIKVLQAILGLYGTTFRIDALLKSKFESDGNAPTPEFAKLEGVRLAVANEIPQGRFLDVGPFKDLTGGDAIPVRQLHQPPKIIQPTHKFIFTGQNLPEIQNIKDVGLRERMIFVDFTQSFIGDKCDSTLKQRLLQPEVLSGALSVLVEECMAWQRDGLIFSEAMTEKKKSYIADNDFVQEFISEYCIVASDKTCLLKDLVNKLIEIYQDSLAGMTRRSISEMLKRSIQDNVTSKHSQKGTKLFGIGLATSAELENLFSKPTNTDKTESALEGETVDDDDLPF